MNPFCRIMVNATLTLGLALAGTLGCSSSDPVRTPFAQSGSSSGSSGGGSGTASSGASGAGTGSSGTSVGASDGGAATCDSYCTAITANCTGANAQYASKADCMTACAFFPTSDPTGNTVACRAGVAAMAATAAPANCWHAGPLTYGSCGDECAAFCVLVTGYCSAAGGFTGTAPYTAMTDCISACQGGGRVLDNTTPGYSYSPTGGVMGDTMECRMSDLVGKAMLSSANQQAECPKLGVTSPICMGPPPMPEGGPTVGVVDGGMNTAKTTDGGVPTTITSMNWSETMYPFTKRRMLLRDEGDPHLHLLDLGNPANNWSTPTDGAWARSAQLVGGNRVLGGRNDGYEEYDLKTGMVVHRVQGFPNTMSAYRMHNGETMLTQSGTVLTFLDATDKVTHKISYPGYGYVRLARPTRNGTFLVPSDSKLFEGDSTGKVLWSTTGAGWAHIWEPLLMADGNVLLCTAFGSSCDVVDKTSHTVTKRFGGKNMPMAAMFSPNFFSEYEILPNGNIITSNWQGHGPGNGMKGIQVIEFDPTGTVVWFYKQDPTLFSSIQGVMVLDGKDPQYLHVEETADSTWQPVK